MTIGRIPSLRALWVPVITGAATLACGDDATGPAAVSVERLEIEPPSVELEVGTSVALGVTAVDAAGRDVSGSTEVSWSSEPPTIARVSDSGRVTGLAPGTATIRASADGVSATAGVLVRAPASLRIVTPALQPGLVGGAYRALLRATGAEAADLTWSLASGSLPAGLELVGDAILGTPRIVGTSAFTLSLTDGSRTQGRSFTLTVVSDDPSRFDLTPLIVGDVEPTVQREIDAALARWERIVSGDIAGGRIPEDFLDPERCGGFGAVLNGASFDDLIVVVLIGPIDGAGGQAGGAGPCVLNGDGLTSAGLVRLDVDDLAVLLPTGEGRIRIQDILLHELAHVLGFGPLWDAAGHELLTGAGGFDPRYIGAAALAEFGALGGHGTIPLENDGGPGPSDSHWEEDGVGINDLASSADRIGFGRELMTAFGGSVDGNPLPLSRMTIATLADLGYEVDFSGADSYTLDPVTAAIGSEPGQDIQLSEIVLDRPLRLPPRETPAAPPNRP